MGKQFIVSIGREFGSGGHEIGEILAKRLNVSFYDRKMLDEMAKEMGIAGEELEKYDERPRRLYFSRRVRNFSNSPEDIVADMQFDYIRKKAASGESFVIVGRCADAVLSDNEGLIAIFITGDEDNKLIRVKEKYNLSEKEAAEKMHRHDHTRRKYHNHYTDSKWGDSRYYDLCINSQMGVEKTADVLMNYIENRKSCM